MARSGAGTSAAPAITRQNANRRALTPSGARPDRLAEHEDAADDRGEVGRHGGDRDHLDGLTELKAAGGGVEGDDEGDQRRERPRAEQAEQRPVRVCEVLDGDVGDPEQDARGGRQQERFAALGHVATRRDPHEHGARRQEGALDGDQGRQRGALRTLCVGRQTDDRQSRGGDRHADPLTSSQGKPEDSLGEHRQEDEPSGHDRLHGGQGRERERSDVQSPRHDRDEPPHRKPLRAKQAGRAAHQMAHPDRRGEHRAAMLEQEPQVGAERRPHRQDQSQEQGISSSLGIGAQKEIRRMMHTGLHALTAAQLSPSSGAGSRRSPRPARGR